MKLSIAHVASLPLIVTVGACGHAAGTRPHDMSAPQHEAAAAQEDEQASEHAAQHDPKATTTEERCSAGKGRVCWTATTNPTARHVKTSAEHRELATQHRAASRALRDAEARACGGISEDDRDTSPFAHVADIRSVTELKGESQLRTGKVKTERTVGATITLNAVPGLTEEWLQRIVNCHLARNAAVGHEMAEMPYCPLVPRGAEATVRSVGDGFAVDVKAEEADTSREIWRRAQNLKPGS